MLRKYKFIFLNLLFLIACTFVVLAFHLLTLACAIAAKVVVMITFFIGFLVLAFSLYLGILFLIWFFKFKETHYSFYYWIHKK